MVKLLNPAMEVGFPSELKQLNTMVDKRPIWGWKTNSMGTGKIV
jgi:hypothetical protein